jgi:hypothetical protein
MKYGNKTENIPQAVATGAVLLGTHPSKQTWKKKSYVATATIACTLSVVYRYKFSVVAIDN